MDRTFSIRFPFFEVGPKTYLYGKDAVEMACFADKLSEKYNIDIIFTAQLTDLPIIVPNVKKLHVFAQHMDGIYPGVGIGSALPEAIKDAGAEGVLLNHTEKPMSLSELNAAIRRADEVGLATIVCAGSALEGAAVAVLKPNIILVESPSLIGTGKRSINDSKEIANINKTIFKIDPNATIMHSAGIHDDQDVYEIIMAGADASGSTSGIIKAKDPFVMFEHMIDAMCRAWKDRTKTKEGFNLY